MLNHKPHPEAINRALEIVKVKVDKAIMVGDTDADICAGRDVGTKTVGVTYGSWGEKIRETNPDFVVDDIKEIIPIIVRKNV